MLGRDFFFPLRFSTLIRESGARAQINFLTIEKTLDNTPIVCYNKGTNRKGENEMKELLINVLAAYFALEYLLPLMFGILVTIVVIIAVICSLGRR